MTPPSNAGGEGRVALETLTPEIVAYFAADPCLIWSEEWRLFWRPGGNGYTGDQGEAWHLTLGEAYARTRHCDPSKGIVFVRPARENADDRAPTLVEAAVAEMRERAAKACDTWQSDSAADVAAAMGMDDEALYAARRTAEGLAAAIRALGTPSQEASNVGCCERDHGAADQGAAGSPDRLR